MHDEVIKELTGYLELIQSFDKDAAQDAVQLHAYLIQLTQIGARSNLLMAEYQRKFRQEKMGKYYALKGSSEANGKYYSPSLAKDFVDAQCNETGFVFDLACRCSRSCVHTASAVITIISSLKSERQFSNYQ